MSMSLLKNLGVDEAIIHALRKCCGEDLNGLEIEKDDGDLKLLVQCSKGPHHSPHAFTINGFFEKRIRTSGTHAGTSVKLPTEYYNCHDTIEFLPDNNSGKGNVKINGSEMRMGNSMLKLLRYLAEELKKKNGGWVFVQDLVEAEIIRSEGYQPFERLRGAIAGYLLDKNPKDFIEANGRKQYRISTDPDKVLLLDEVKK